MGAWVMSAWGLRLARVAAAVAAMSAPMRAVAQAVPPFPRGTVRTDTLWGNAIGARKAIRVYLPPSYARNPGQRYPLLVYLHGVSGNERNWVDNGALDRTMDSLVATGTPEAIIAMPDGDDSWYTTWGQLPDAAVCTGDTARKEPAATFCTPWQRYDDYIVRDVVDYMDSHYRTRADRAHRAIAGLSMGGYGAITLALANPDRFAAAASHSGVLSTRLMPGKTSTDSGRYARNMAELQRAAGSLWKSQRMAFGPDTIAWRARDPIVMLRRLEAQVKAGKAVMPALYLDVGVDDPWLQHNRDFNAALAADGIARRYGEFTGGHTWTYWRVHAEDSLTFLLAIVGRP